MGQLAIEVQVDERSSKQEIALSELSKGVYVLLVLFEDGSIGRHEVIKE